MKNFFCVFMLCGLLSGCATVNTMAVGKKTKSVDISTKSIVLLSLDMSHFDSTYYVPRAEVVHLERPGAKEKSDRQNFKIDADGMTSTPTGHNSYLLRLALKPGRYEVMDVFGDTGRFPFHGFFSVPLLLDIDVPASSIVYMGRVEAVMRPRQGNEFRAGPVIPLMDQAITGVSTGTFDVVVRNASQTDIPMMRAIFPSLATADIETAMLPAFDRDKVQKWWESDGKNTEAAPASAKTAGSVGTSSVPQGPSASAPAPAPAEEATISGGPQATPQGPAVVAASVPPSIGQSVTLARSTSVRASPTDQTRIIASLPGGAVVTVASVVMHNSSGDWYFVKNGTNTGWIDAPALQP